MLYIPMNTRINKLKKKFLTISKQKKGGKKKETIIKNVKHKIKYKKKNTIKLRLV